MLKGLQDKAERARAGRLEVRNLGDTIEAIYVVFRVQFCQNQMTYIRSCNYEQCGQHNIFNPVFNNIATQVDNFLVV